MRRTADGTLLLIALATMPATSAPAQTADDIAAQFTAATGGADRWAALQSLTVNSRSEFFSFDSVWKKPGKIRIDVWSDASVDTDTRAFDGTSGWRLNSMEGSTKPRSMAAQEMAELREEIHWMRELIDHKALGIKLKLLRTEPVNGQPAYRLEAVSPSGATVHIFVDTKSGFEVQRIKWATAPDGTSHELVLTVGQYKTVSGLLLPHQVGTAKRIYVVDAAVPDSRFQQPGTRER